MKIFLRRSQYSALGKHSPAARFSSWFLSANDSSCAGLRLCGPCHEYTQFSDKSFIARVGCSGLKAKQLASVSQNHKTQIQKLLCSSRYPSLYNLLLCQQRALHGVNRTRAKGTVCDQMSAVKPAVRAQVGEHPSDGATRTTVPDADEMLMNDARDIFHSAVQSVLPRQLIENKLQITHNGTVLKVDGSDYPLEKNVYVIGFGKAVLGMARAVEDVLGEHIVAGVVSVPTGIQQTFEQMGKQDMLLKPSSPIVVMEGAAGNLPDEASHRAASEITKLAQQVQDNHILIVLISGGGSALLPSPRPPVSLADMLTLTKVMSKSGASIIQLNTVRKRVELLKGGGLARIAHPAKVIAFILSDVIGDPLDFIAGGPTVQDTCSTEDSLQVLQELNILDAIPSSVKQLLNEDLIAPKQETDSSDWRLVHNVLVGSNQSACEAACARSATLGYMPHLLSTQVQGEAQDVGRAYVSLAKYVTLGPAGQVSKESSYLESLLMQSFTIEYDKLRQLRGCLTSTEDTSRKGVCIVAGGETTVVVRGQGVGGRNQEMAVAAALVYRTECLTSGGKNVPHSVFLAAGTDGIDGPNTAAGGVVSSNFVTSAEAAGFDAADFLQRNDTFTLLANVNEGQYHIVTGQTGTNVMDIHILLISS